MAAAAASAGGEASSVPAGAPVVIDGKQTAATIRSELKAEVEVMKERFGGKVPGLAVVLVGERRDSATYVRMKKKGCAEVGIRSISRDLPADVSEDELVAVVAELNADPEVHGILVQLPLPDHVNEQRVLDCIDVEKDVDGLHPMNIGALALRGKTPAYTACTPTGCIELLKRYDIPISGKRAVVLGRSNIVGTPVSLMLTQENATVTVCHSRTQGIADEVRRADIVVAAIGRANFVQGDWIKEGAAVIDVGINSVDDPSRKRGYRLVGDVDYAEASKRAGAITPVPGGVGPMTIAMLLSNVVRGAKKAFEAQEDA